MPPEESSFHNIVERHWFKEETVLWSRKAVRKKQSLHLKSQIPKPKLFASLTSRSVAYEDQCPNWRGQELQPQRTTLSCADVSVLLCTHLCPQVKTPLNKQCVSWCLTVCTAHAQLMSIHPGLPVAPLCSLTYSLAHSILPSCSNWHLVQRRADRGSLRPAPPEMWPSCQPSNPVQPPPEPGGSSRQPSPSHPTLPYTQRHSKQVRPSLALQIANQEVSTFTSPIGLNCPS